uniref:Uncharacterized protein n=1 Tax=CrAss-like virus sp. ctYsL76 TaxID=2826826 RepID=A0A8S5QLI9_9CAUD|nr:MAG TPA: hypothetical protein [CrAss-like virus sp. ctYsL76]
MLQSCNKYRTNNSVLQASQVSRIFSLILYLPGDQGLTLYNIS